MKRLLTTLVVGMLLGLLVAMSIFLSGMRSNSPVVVDRVRRFNRAVTNPRVMRTAGDPGNTTSVVRHVGRTSGADYATPVGAVETDDGFAIALPYRMDADWMKNVLAAGSATIVRDGVENPVAQPEVVPMAEVIDFFGPNDNRAFSVFNVEQALRVRHAGS